MSYAGRRFSFVILALFVGSTARAGELPGRVGACVKTKIAAIGTRIDTPGSGSAVRFANGGVQISYDTVPEIEHDSRVGDPVRMCLVSIPSGCPKGDDRGRVYHTTNLRTHGSWRLPDAAHACGGA